MDKSFGTLVFFPLNEVLYFSQKVSAHVWMFLDKFVIKEKKGKIRKQNRFSARFDIHGEVFCKWKEKKD